jgi:hypothetical protein
MVISSEACVMLLPKPFFKTFTGREICNTSTHNAAPQPKPRGALSFMRLAAGLKILRRDAEVSL